MGFDQLQNPDPRTEKGSDQLKNALDVAAAQVPLPKTPMEIQAEQKQAEQIAEAEDANAQGKWDAYARKADEAKADQAKKGQEGVLLVGDPAQIRLKKPAFVQSEAPAGEPETQVLTSLPSEIGVAAVGQLAEIIPINGEPMQPEPPTPQPEHHDVA